MKVRVNNKTYSFHFQHQPNVHERMGGSAFKTYRDRPGLTQCFIDEVIDEAGKPTFRQVAAGQARCDKYDTYDKEKGRRLSLDRALKQAFPEDRVTRVLFWEIYMNRKPTVQA